MANLMYPTQAHMANMERHALGILTVLILLAITTTKHY